MEKYISTRQEAADILNISVRSIDRYIKAGKMRSEKIGKKVYVNSDDINNMNGNDDKKQIIITEPEKKVIKNNGEQKIIKKASNEISNKGDFDKLTKTFENIYTDLMQQIEKKDKMIQEMSVKIGRTEEQVKNSISVSEHNRSQMILEESKGCIEKKISGLDENKKKLEKDIKKERVDKNILIVIVFLLLLLASYFGFKLI